MEQYHPDIVAIGGSAGGLDAIGALLGHFPPDLPAAVLIVMHWDLIPDFFARRAKMPVILAQNGDRLQTGKCYLGPPGAHLTVERGGVIKLLADGFYQAHAIDVLFQSLALNAGSRTIGVVVSGMLKDGTVGLRAIKQAGGFALVQAPEEALHKDMPQNAIEFDGNIDFIGTVEAIADEIFRLVGTPAHLDLSSAEPRRLAQDQAENSP